MGEKLKVVVVTGTQPHHLALCAGIHRDHELVGVIQPAIPGKGAIGRLRGIYRRHGFGMTLLNVLGKLLRPQDSLPSFRKTAGVMEQMFHDVRAFEEIPKSRIHTAVDVKSAGCVALLERLAPDVMVCLGGPVYPPAFIRAVPVALNFHSGISPIYNGTQSIDFAYANGHPHLCGGTMMMLAAEVDGGGMLGHFLPRLESTDTPASLFGKTADGCIRMYLRLLRECRSLALSEIAVRQPPPLFYTRGADYGWQHNLSTRAVAEAGIPTRVLRGERIIEYWKQPDRASATESCRKELDRLLWGVEFL